MLYTLFDRGVPRPLAFVFRPDWIDHVGELTLCVLAHGGNQDVTNFINAEARLPDLMSRTFGTFVDDDGAEVEPAETESYHPSKLVFVAVAGIGWSRTEAGGWNSELGEGTQLLGPPDVDFFARLPAIAERLFGELFERTFFVRPKASVFARDLFFGFSSGAGLGFRIAAEQHRSGLGDGKRARQPVPLGEVAALRSHSAHFVRRFDAFCNDVEPQCVGKLNCCAHDGSGDGTGPHSDDKTAVNLEDIHRKSVQVRECAITRTKIVNCHTETVFSQCEQCFAQAIRVFDQQAFGQFQHQMRRIYAGSRYDLPGGSQEVGRSELTSRNIHRHIRRRTIAGGRPLSLLLGCRL